MEQRKTENINPEPSVLTQRNQNRVQKKEERCRCQLLHVAANRSLTQRGPAGDFIDHWHKQVVPTNTIEEEKQKKQPECSKARIIIRKVMQQHTQRKLPSQSS